MSAFYAFIITRDTVTWTTSCCNGAALWFVAYLCKFVVFTHCQLNISSEPG